MEVLHVALGGICGVLLRFYVGQFLAGMLQVVPPWPTFCINFVGSFCMGMALTVLPNTSARLFWTVGLLGGFTTFSSFAYENVALLQRGEYGMCAIYCSASVFFGILGAYLGIRVMQ